LESHIIIFQLIIGLSNNKITDLIKVRNIIHEILTTSVGLVGTVVSSASLTRLLVLVFSIGLAFN
jgi:hypothetical protein